MQDPVNLVWGLGFQIWSFRFGFSGLGVRVHGVWLVVWEWRFGVWGSELRVWGLGLKVWIESRL